MPRRSQPRPTTSGGPKTVLPAGPERPRPQLNIPPTKRNFVLGRWHEHESPSGSAAPSPGQDSMTATTSSTWVRRAAATATAAPARGDEAARVAAASQVRPRSSGRVGAHRRRGGRVLARRGAELRAAPVVQRQPGRPRGRSGEGARVPYLVVAETGPATLRFTLDPVALRRGGPMAAFPTWVKGGNPYAGHGPGAAGSPAARRGGPPAGIHAAGAPPRQGRRAQVLRHRAAAGACTSLLITGGHAGFGRPIVIGVLRHTDSDSPCSRLRADQGYIPRTGDGFA